MQYALAGDDEGRSAQADLVILGHLPDAQKSCIDAYQTRIDFFFAPEEAREILHPFEVADSDAARIGDHVGQYQHAVVVQNVIGLGSRWAVRAFNYKLGFDLVGVARVICLRSAAGIMMSQFTPQNSSSWPSHLRPRNRLRHC